MQFLGDFTEDFTAVPCLFTTHQASGAAVAPLSAFEAADIKIFKDGSDTEKTSTNGLTMTSPFNGSTGLHRLLIDTSNDTGDASFWAAGHVYTILLEPDSETVDGVTVLRVIGQFTIGMATTSVAAIKAKTDSLTFTQAGIVDANIQYVNDVAVTGTGALGDEWGP